MKKLVVLTVLIVAITGFAAAGGLVFQLGAGYHSSYVGDISELPSEVAGLNMPLGIGGYVGLGYGFGDKKALSIGAEFAPAWDFTVSPFGVSNFVYQARAFVKWKPSGMFTLTPFIGYAGNSFFGTDLGSYTANGSAALGARVTLLFLYAEYAAILPWDFSTVAKHEIGLGFAFFK